MPLRRQWIWVVSLAALAPAICHAEGPGLVELDGKVQAATWSSNRLLDDRTGGTVGLVSLVAKARPSDQLRLYIDASIGSTAYFAGEKRGIVREAYVDVSLPQFDLRAGKMLLPWGRTDRINPTDSLTSRDFRWLAAEEEDQRFGNAGIRITKHYDAFALTGVWLPSLRSTRVPLDLALQQQTAVTQPAQRNNVAVKLDRAGEGLDWSVSYYSGASTSPSLESATPGSGTPLKLVNYPIRRIGADAAASFDAYSVRAEVSYTTTDAAGSSVPNVNRRVWFGVVGIERQFAGNVNANLQLVMRHSGAWRSAGSWGAPLQTLAAAQLLISQQPVKTLSGIAFRIAKKALSENLEAELSGITYGNAQGRVVRPRLRYKLNDSASIVLGLDVYAGPANGLLGSLKANNAAFAQVQVAF